MRSARYLALSLLSVLGLSAAGASNPQRVLACDMSALTAEQRARHREMTTRLLAHATIKELHEGYELTVERPSGGDARAGLTAPELAEWVANESRCCPALDFHLALPAFGPLTLRLDGGPDVKRFIAAELHLGKRTP